MMNNKIMRDKKGRFKKGYPTMRDHSTGKFTTSEKMDHEVEETRQHILDMWFMLAGGEKRLQARHKRNCTVDDKGVVDEFDVDENSIKTYE